MVGLVSFVTTMDSISQGGAGKNGSTVAVSTSGLVLAQRHHVVSLGYECHHTGDSHPPGPDPGHRVGLLFRGGSVYRESHYLRPHLWNGGLQNHKQIDCKQSLWQVCLLLNLSKCNLSCIGGTHVPKRYGI